jgi:hypothetical protein
MTFCLLVCSTTDLRDPMLEILNLRAFSECERILDVDAQGPNGALDFCMAEQDRHGAQVARLLVMMDALVLRNESVP